MHILCGLDTFVKHEVGYLRASFLSLNSVCGLCFFRRGLDGEHFLVR